MTKFDAKVIAAVTSHMNTDHPEDNLLITRAFDRPEITHSTMVSLDDTAGIWRVVDAQGEREVRIAWPTGAITERADIRREVVTLYKSACQKLGVQPREEHGANHPNSHGSHGNHGNQGAHSHHNTDSGTNTPATLSKAIRSASWGDHADSESQSVMEDIMQMRASLADYTSLVVQHYYMYEALEQAAKQIAADSRYAKLHPQDLVRESALIEDLEFLIGENWRETISPLPATKAYAERINQVAAEKWLPGIIAHHYTRYLGDLSGGQMIAKRVKQQHGFDHAGVSFYDFSGLESLASFKNEYRETLDALGEEIGEDQWQRVVDEVRLAYRFNTEVFVDMQKARATN